MFDRTAITIGNLDGVHRGHQALLSAAREAAGEGGRVVAMSFDPHPMTALRPQFAPARLTHFDERRRLLIEYGADEVVRLAPTPEVLGQSPEEFVASVVEKYQPTAIVEGGDFRFGKRRAGSVETLHELEKKYGYETIVIDPVEAELADQSVVRVSSTMIRWLLDRGRVRDAAQLLGRDYELVGRVVRGEQRGRDLGFPTANLDCGDQLLPADGVYAGSATVGENGQQKDYPAAISVGTNPTFGDDARRCEAHLLDFDGPLDAYDWPIRLRFADWLRDQIAYRGAEPLIEQLHRDVAETRRVVLSDNKRMLVHD